MDDRRRGKSGPCWRGMAKDKGFAGRPTPTGASARRGKRTGVGVTRRRTKALPGGQRQHGPPRAEENTGPVGVAWRRTKALRGGQRQHGPPRAEENTGPVGVAWRRTKALRRGRRQQGHLPARKIRALLAWRDERQRLCGEAMPTWAANGAESPGPVGVARKVDNLFSLKKRILSENVILYINHMPHWHMVLQMHR